MMVLLVEIVDWFDIDMPMKELIETVVSVCVCCTFILHKQNTVNNRQLIGIIIGVVMVVHFFNR